MAAPRLRTIERKLRQRNARKAKKRAKYLKIQREQARREPDQQI